MKLKSIRLSGFKSFVDPITIELPDHLIAILGPNGCGKSNIIDAIKFVLGARSDDLRGDKKEDVIFNGSEHRKPLGRASVELIFDNSAQTLQGEYGSLSEIQIKREIFRNGDTKYFLNGTHCRRKDIQDIFTGTGLKWRDYAIIEQGTISEFIEAKPEVLRSHVEAVAGTAVYKERRRETEIRLQHTKENLERLNDIREEMGRHLLHLEKQSQAAQHYQDLKSQERQTRAHLLGLRYQQHQREYDESLQQHQTLQLTHNELEAQVIESDTKILNIEQVIQDFKENIHEHDQKFHLNQNTIITLEQELKYSKEKEHHIRISLSTLEQDITQFQQTLKILEEKNIHLTSELHTLMPEAEEKTKNAYALKNATQEHEQQLKHLQEVWDSFHQRTSQISQHAQAEEIHVHQLEQKIAELKERKHRFNLELEQISLLDPHQEKENLEHQFNEVLLNYENTETQLKEILEKNKYYLFKLKELQEKQTSLQTQLQKLSTQYTSLQALQKVALHKQDQSLVPWLQSQGLEKNSSLAELIRVKSGYEKAVETVLGDYLTAIGITDFNQLPSLLKEKPKSNLHLFNLEKTASLNKPQTILIEGLSYLSDYLESTIPLPAFFYEIYFCETFEEAWPKLSQLKTNESIVTRDGWWMSPSWVHIFHTEHPHLGVLAREQELINLHQEILILKEEEKILMEQKEEFLFQSQQGEEEYQKTQQTLNRLIQERAQLEAQIQIKTQTIENLEQRRQKLKSEIQDFEHHIEQNISLLENTKIKWNSALAQIENDKQDREQLIQQKTVALNHLQTIRVQSEEAQQFAHQLQIKLHSVEHQIEHLHKEIQTLKDHLKNSEQKKETYLLELNQIIPALDLIQQQLHHSLLERQILDEHRIHLNNQLNMHEKDLNIFQQDKQNKQGLVQQNTQKLQQLELTQQSLKVRLDTYLEQCKEMEWDLKYILKELSANNIETQTPHQEAQLEKKLHQLKQHIEKSGAVNLAAISEYHEQAQRKQTLDDEHEDIITAITTLEQAINRIDQETTERFRESFENLNKNFGILFGKIFNGGQAALTLTEKDLLTTGITITAQPPGKRNSSIHLLSGGEKALTAIALVFAIFQLNPAPFCLLDEVDAPLDDANVTRFCNLVKEMSETIQFLYISHNRVSMEMAHQLIGVTMQEAGVSRIVSVNIAQAIAQANNSASSY